MASLDKHPVFYASFTVVNNGPTTPAKGSDNIPALILQQYPSPIINKASDYVCSVERMEININGVPFYDGTGESLTTTLGGNTLDLSTIRAYSLVDLLSNLDILLKTSGVSEFFSLNFELNTEGFVLLTHLAVIDFGMGLDALWSDLFGILDMTEAPRLNNIFGFHDFEGVADLANNTLTLASVVPRMDCGDQLSFLRLTTNLPTVSERIGQSTGGVLTDFYISKNIGSSVNYNTFEPANPSQAGASLGYSPRQKVLYVPEVRRFLRLRGSRPIDEILLSCEFVRPDGTSAIIPLPLGCEFTCKLGFWNLLNDETPKDSNFQSKLIQGREMVVF